MIVQLNQNTKSKLILSDEFLSEKERLKKYLDKAVDLIVNRNQKRIQPYFIVFHEKSDAVNSRQKISVSCKLPGFITNSIVFWVCNTRGICEWLWTVHPATKGQSQRVEFNTSGVAYLQAKGAMPS